MIEVNKVAGHTACEIRADMLNRSTTIDETSGRIDDQRANQAVATAPSTAALPSTNVAVMLPPSSIRASKSQARKAFPNGALMEMAASMGLHGMLQAIVVRPLPQEAQHEDEQYELVAGERRWRAAKILEWEEIPAIIRDYSEDVALEAGLVENLQREDLSLLEAAAALKSMCDEHEYSLDKLAKRIGKPKSWVEDRLRVANAPADIRDMVAQRANTLTHVRELCRLTDNKQRDLLIKEVLNNLTVARLRERIVEMGGATSGIVDIGAADAQGKAPAHPMTPTSARKVTIETSVPASGAGVALNSDAGEAQRIGVNSDVAGDKDSAPEFVALTGMAPDAGSILVDTTTGDVVEGACDYRALWTKEKERSATLESQVTALEIEVGRLHVRVAELEALPIEESMVIEAAPSGDIGSSCPLCFADDLGTCACDMDEVNEEMERLGRTW